VIRYLHLHIPLPYTFSGLLNLLAPKNKVFVLGESGIETKFKAEGIKFISGTDPSYPRDLYIP
jgi:4-nitrophenyl phosphatase